MKQGKKFGKRISAWLLTFIMIAGLVTVPAGEVKAADGGFVTVENATSTSNSVYVVLKPAGTIKAGTWGTNSPAVDLTEYSVNIQNNSSGIISDWEITIELTDASSWNAGWNGASISGKTITIGTYRGIDKEKNETWTNAEIAKGETAVTGAGFQIAASAIDNAKVTLKYKEGETSGEVSKDDTLTDPSVIGDTSELVKAKIEKDEIAGEYHAYYLQVNNGLSESISDWIVAIPLEGIISSEQWGDWAKVKTSYTASYLYLTPATAAVIPAGGTFGSTTEGAYKFNYKGSKDLDTSKAVVYYKTGNTSSGAFDNVVDNASQASGGSGGSGNTGGSGGVQGDTTTDKNLDIEYNFAKLLQYSLYFYDANMCGELEGKCAVDWRSNCHLADKKVTYNGQTIDVSGGFHDAGDHDKFGLPQGYSASVLGMGYYEFKDAYVKTGQVSHFKTILDHFCDYFVRCTVLDASKENAIAFCYQVGDGASHNQWVSAETENINRPAYFADSSNPATDQVSEAAAALAIHYMNFGNKEYLDCAKKLFAMAKKNRKAAKGSDGGDFYGSSGWEDDYCLAAAWLYKATNDESYLTEYNAYKNSSNVKTGSWPSWDDVGPYALAYGSGDFSPLAANVTATLNGTQTISNGYAWLCMWGSARYNCNMQLEGLIYDKNSGKDQQYTEWANGQMKFLLGNSDDKRCYVVGYNENSSKYPHHRSASGYSGWPGDGNNHTVQAHVLTGALVGGIESSDGTYHDDSNDYYCNEVAIDYNAAFTGAAAALYLFNEDDEDQMLDSNYDIDDTATCPSNEGGIAKNGGDNEEKTVLADKDITFPTAKGITYGDTLKDAVLSITKDDYGTYAWKDATVKPAVGTQTYDVVYTPTNTKKYDYSKLTGYDAATKTVIRKVSVTVSKKTLTAVTFPTVSGTVTAGTKLKDVKLSKEKDDYGTFVWEKPDTVVTGAMTGANVVYTLTDTKNVVIDSKVTGVNAAGTSVTRTVTFTVKKDTPTVTGPGSIEVTAGTKLSEVSLDDWKASVAGAFSWEEKDQVLTYDDNDREFTLVFTPTDINSYAVVKKTIVILVTKLNYKAAPSAPVLEGKTATTVTLKKYTGDNAEAIQYGIRTGATGSYKWQDSNEFKNLSSYTTYNFAQKFKATNIYNESKASEALAVTTYFTEDECYEVDLSKLPDDKYVEAHNGKISFKDNVLYLEEEGSYTITGENADITIVCKKSAKVILDNATFKRLEAEADLDIELVGDNVITDGISVKGKLTIRNKKGASGSLTVTNSDGAAIEADTIVIESGQVEATGNPALKAKTEIDLNGGSLTANTESETEPPIVARDGDNEGKIVWGDCQVTSKSENVFSPNPVDSDDKPVDELTITYEVDGKEYTAKVRKGASIELETLPKKPGYKAEGWYTDDDKDTILLPGTMVENVTESVTYHAKYKEITGKLTYTVDEDSTKPLTVGYTEDDGILVTIKNETNVTIDTLKFTLKSGDYFTVEPKTISDLESGKTTQVRVKLKKGMSVNEEGYTDILSISCEEADTVTIPITRVVQKATADAPTKKPELLRKTADSIVLKNAGAGYEYGIKKSATGEFIWQKTTSFEKLDSYTEYIFALRYAATDDKEASPAGPELHVFTYFSNEDCYVVDISEANMKNDEYVEAHNGTISVEDDTLYLEEEGTYIIKGKNPNLKIHAKKNVTIIFEDAEVGGITGDGDIDIELKGDSKIAATEDGESGIETEGKVTIKKNKDAENGSLDVEGGAGAPGIKAGEVVIEDGDVTVKGGSNAPGIQAGKVVVEGGDVTVTGQGDQPAIDAPEKDIKIPITEKNGSEYKDDTKEDDKKGDDEKDDGKGDDGDDEDDEIQAESMQLTGSVKGVSNISIKNKSTYKLAPNKKLTLKVAFLPEDAEKESLTFKSSNTKVATVNGKGVVTAKKAGKTTITVTSEYGLKQTFTVQVTKKAVKKVKIKAAKKTVKVKKTLKLKAVITPGKKFATTSVYWKSSKPKIATVTQKGVVKGLKKGKTKITAIAMDGSGKKATVTITVKK